MSSKCQPEDVDPANGSAANLRLRRAEEADWHLLRSWIARDDVQRWWGSPSTVEAEIRIVFETPNAVAHVIELDGSPIGYCHAIDATHWGTELPTGIPPGSWDIDIMIAHPVHRGTGIGNRALDLLAEEVFTTTFALALSVLVPVKIESTVRAFERAGFKWQRVVEDHEFGSAWIMLRSRP